MSNLLYDPKVFEKLQAIRKREDLTLKPCSRLREKLADGTQLTLRNYQRQMVVNLLYQKRFVLGDDPGLGKCVTGDTLIQTDEGLVPIQEMHDWSHMKPDSFEKVTHPWRVAVGGESLPVKNFYYGGLKPTIRVKTRYGFEVEGSRIHPLLVKRPEGLVWVKLEDLREGDYLCVARQESPFPSHDPILNVENNQSSHARYFDLPRRLTPALARLLGYIVAEGWANSRVSFSISQCPKKNPEINADIRDLVQSLLGYELKEQKDMLIHSVQIRAWLEVNGVQQVLAASKNVPPCILRGTRQSNIEFLKALFESEGSTTPSGLEFSSASKTLARQVQIMLARLGIIAKKSPKKVAGREHVYWRLTIFGQDAVRFQEQIGFISPRKTQKLKEALSMPRNPNHDNIPHCKLLCEKLRERLTQRVSQTGANDKRSGSGLKQFGKPSISQIAHIRQGRNPTYTSLQKILEVCKVSGMAQLPEYQEAIEITSSHYFYDPVVSLEENENEVYDIEVDDERHWFVGNGLMNHNTLECIAALCYMWEKEPDIVPIVITTTSALHQFAGEIRRFTHGVEAIVVEGSPQKRLKTYESFFKDWSPDKPAVLLTNYPRLRNDRTELLEAIPEGCKLCVFADEIQAVKNPDSATHHAVKNLSARCDRFYGMTATLIKNNLTEGFGIYKVVLPHLFPSIKYFYRHFCVMDMQQLPGRKGRKIPIVVGHSKEHIKNFRSTIEPFYLGRAKAEVATELPSLTIKTIDIRSTSAQWAQYVEALQGLLEVNKIAGEGEGLEGGDEKEVTKLTQLIYTQQIVNSPYLIGNEGPSGKENYFLDLLEEELEDQKVIVFTRFKGMVDRFGEILEQKLGYTNAIKQEGKAWVPDMSAKKGYVRVTGDEDSAQREAGRRAFTESEGTNIIFITAAGLEAINLQKANVMVFYDLPWSAGDYIQCLDQETEILTAEGWRGRGQVRKGDLVAAFNPDSAEISWQPALEIYDRPLGEEERFYSLPYRHINFRVTGGHKMLYKEPDQAVWQWCTAEELAQKKAPYKLPVSGVQQSKGVTLSDTKLEALGKELRSVETLRIQGKAPLTRECPIREQISHFLEDLTPAQLSSLLKGLHEEGIKDFWGPPYYAVVTTDTDFADKLQSLCVRRGFQCNQSANAPSDPVYPQRYVLDIYPKTSWELISLPRTSGLSVQESPAKEGEPVWCVENALNTLITRRRGKVMIMGNCVGRMIRIGSEHEKVYALHLLAEGPDGQKTIDHHVQKTLDKKMQLVEAILGSRLNRAEDEEVNFIKDRGRSDLDDIYSAMTQSAKDLKR